MNTQTLTKLAHELQVQLPFYNGINTKQEHEEALLLMDQLTEDYQHNLLLIDVLWPKIEMYEDTAAEYIQFNDRINNLNPGASMLRTLMDQHNLNTSSFKNEIGVKSTVSLICNGKRELTIKHIRKLAGRFNLSPELFI